MATIVELNDHIKNGKFAEVERVAHELLKMGMDPQEIIKDGIVPTLDDVGQKFSAGECFIPEMLIAAKSSQKILDILKPRLVQENYEPRGKVVIGTVKGDMHDIGKNMVAMLIESAGFEVKDLGVDVSSDVFVDTIKEIKPQVVGLSCLLTTTMVNMKGIVGSIKEATPDDDFKIIIGGPPTSEQFAREIGADYYGRDAYAGLEILKGIATVS